MDSGLADKFLRDVFLAGLSRADPRHILPGYLPEKPKGRCIVVGAGKAAAAMAQAVEAAWNDVDMGGVVVVPYDHGAPTHHVEVLEAAHPVPDQNSALAACRMVELLGTAGPGDLVLALFSGGGSSLLTLPAPTLGLEDAITVYRVLHDARLSRADRNRVLCRLSAIKGGRLARASRGARIVTLAISDVPGEQPHEIACGPTLPSPSAMEDLSPIVDRLGDVLPGAAREILLDTPLESPDFETDFRLIASPKVALDAAAEAARQAGVTPIIIGETLEAGADRTGSLMAGIARSVALNNRAENKVFPALLLSGGEVPAPPGAIPGRSGRNTAFLVSLALGLEGQGNIYAFAGDTDGIDGTGDAAGAIMTPDTLSRARAIGIDPRQTLAGQDSYSLFSALGDLIVTGPTLTSVNDLRGILILN